MTTAECTGGVLCPVPGHVVVRDQGQGAFQNVHVEVDA